MIFTALSYLLIVALAIAALGTLLLPVYVWVLARDKAQAADLANARHYPPSDVAGKTVAVGGRRRMQTRKRYERQG